MTILHVIGALQPLRVAAAALVQLAATFAVLPPATLRAQPQIHRIGGPNVAAHVQIAPRTGRFWITSGYTSRDSIQLLFGAPTHVTSNVIFRISRGASTEYYCNAPPDEENRPRDPFGAGIPYRPFDAVSAGRDTLALEWRDVGGFDITMRFIPDRDAWAFVNGGDVLVEFDYRLRTGSPPATLGIAVMLDLFNNDRGTSGSEDRAEILSESSYHVAGERSRTFRSPVPAWYLVGKFSAEAPRTRFFGIHRLAGRSRSGAPLDPPQMLTFNRWVDLREAGWDPPATDAPFFDCASFMRWSDLVGEGTIRTAFGLNDAAGNAFAFGYAPSFFAAIAGPASLRRHTPSAPGPTDFTVEAWVVRTSGSSPELRTFRMNVLQNDGKSGLPAWLTLLSAEEVDADVVRDGPVRLVWRYRARGFTADSMLSFQLQSRSADAFWSDLRYGGTAVVRLLWADEKSPSDVTGPLVLRVDSTTAPEHAWTLRTRDRPTGDAFSGIERVTVRSIGADSLVNVRLYLEPASWLPCDSSTITLRITIIDAREPADVVVAVTDCSGNSTVDTLRYRPGVTAAPTQPEPSEALSGRIVPFPCTGPCDGIALELPRPASCPAELRLRSADGRLIEARDVGPQELANGRLPLGAAVSTLPAGLYLVELISSCGTVRVPMMIAR